MDILNIREETYLFWRNLILIVAFFIITPTTLFVSAFSLVSLKKNQSQTPVAQQTNLSTISGVKVFASLPSNLPSVSGSAEVKDARAEIIKNYLSSFGSPLTSYSDLIVQTADKYNLDFRLVTAIAQKESNLCKIIPPGSFNCWGWGITGQDTLGFSSFGQGIEQVSKGLREDYYNQGFDTIEKIMSKYTPLSNGSWAQGVNEFMKEME